MELHCIYLGRDGAGAWTKTSQDQSDSSTGKLQTVPLRYSAAASTARVCQDLWAWKQTCACLKQKQALSKKRADVKHFSQVVPITKSVVRNGCHISLKCEHCKRRAQWDCKCRESSQTLLSQRYFHGHEAPGYHLCLWTDFPLQAFGLSPAPREC